MSDSVRTGAREPLLVDRLVPAEPGRVRPLAAEVRAAVAGLVADERRDDVEQAVAEVLANAVEHGSGAGDAVRVRVEVGADEVVVRVADAGHGAIPERSQVEGLDPAAPGAERGRGLWLVERLAERVTFRRTAAGRVVEVGWRRPPSAPVPATHGEP